MKNIDFSKILLLLLAMTITTATAQAQWAVGVKAGSTGIGGEVTKALGGKFNARLSGSLFSYGLSGTYEDQDPSIAYNVDASVTSIGAILDYYVFKPGSKFKLSTGVFYHDFSIGGDATPSESYTISGKTFSPDKLGSLNGNVEYRSKIVPYAGIGLGNAVADGNRFKFNVELGAIYSNSPKVTMEGEGMIGPTADQGQDFEDGLSAFNLYPVLNLGFSYRIGN